MTFQYGNGLTGIRRVHAHAVGDVVLDDPQHPVVFLRVLVSRVPAGERDVDGVGHDVRVGRRVIHNVRIYCQDLELVLITSQMNFMCMFKLGFDV